VGNLSFNTDNNSLYAHFTSAGPVVFANVVSRDGRSRGFGFVEYEVRARRTWLAGRLVLSLWLARGGGRRADPPE
jgi:hypothetical protein